MQMICHIIQQQLKLLVNFTMEISPNLLHYLGLNRVNSRGPFSTSFPIDEELNVQKVISHPASKQIWSIIKSKQTNKILVKKIGDLYKQLKDMSVCETQKSVCAKIVKGGETIVECYQCRVDDSCIICMECFKNGNHKGHRVVFKKAGGGCCDCGDSQAWSQEGFCSKHSGKEKQIIIDEAQMKKSKQMLFELFFFYSFLKLTDNKLFSQFFEGFFDLLIQMVRIGLKGIKLVADFFNSQLPKKLTISNNLNQKILEQLFKIQFSRQDFRNWQNLFIQMFPYYAFKQQLISAYMKTFNVLYANQSQTGLSISCQIITSYKLVEDYADSHGAVPILVTPSLNITQIQHLSRMFVYDLDKITSLQGKAPQKYWKMQLKYGVSGLFGYYQSLKLMARREREKAAQSQQDEEVKAKLKKEKQTKIQKRKKKRAQSDSESQNEDKSFSILQFLKRNNKLIQLEHSILEQFLHVLPLLINDSELVNALIKDLVSLIVKQVTLQDDLIIFRPYQRMLALLLLYLAQQTPFLLTGETLRTKIQASGLSEQKWSWFLKAVQQRMTQTLSFYSYLQTHQDQNYHHIFYVYIVLYCSNYYLLGYIDILSIKQAILLGAPQLTLDFKSLAKINFYEQEQKWSLKIVSNLVAQLGLIYTGHFAEIYITHFSLKTQVKPWIQQQAKLLIGKFITSLGGSANLQKIQQFCKSFITNDEEKTKNYLKTLCNFNKQKKLFQLIPKQQDKTFPINFKDFGLRVKIFNEPTEQLPPSSTLQFITKENKQILAAIWNKKNIDSLCSILLQVLDQVQNKKSKDQFIDFFSIPCRLSLFLKNSEVPQPNYTSLTQLLQNLDVSAQIRKNLGPLANQLPSITQNQSLNEQQAKNQKQLQKQKKMKKLEELKKRNSQNLSKINKIHQLGFKENEDSAQQCVICRKSGGSLVWVSRLSIKNLQKIYGQGDGVLTLSFTSCYHAFDYECVLEHSIKRSSHQILFRCPVCRTLGNVLININLTHESQVYIDAILDRILQVTITLRNYKQLNIIQELLKGFYHYVLLGYTEPLYVKQKRLKLYQKIIAILIHMKDQQKINMASKNLEEHKIALIPKIAAEQKQKIDLKEVEVRQIQSYSESEASDEEMQIWTINRKKAKEEKQRKQQQELKKDQQQKIKKEKQQYSSTFYYTLRRIIDHVKAKRFQIQQKMINESEKKQQINVIQPQQKIRLMNTQVPDWAISLLDQLLEEKNVMQFEWKSPKLIPIKNLPEKYYWDMTWNTCDYCKKICGDVFVCLLCDWKGCLNTCKKGGMKKHNRNRHGQNGAFLRQKDATVYLMSPGQIRKAGCLYLNQWGQDFNIKKDWNHYFLQTSVIDQTLGMLLKDQ